MIQTSRKIMATAKPSLVGCPEYPRYKNVTRKCGTAVTLFVFYKKNITAVKYANDKVPRGESDSSGVDFAAGHKTDHVAMAEI